MSFGYIGDTSTSVKQQVKNKGILTTQESFDLERQGFLGGSLEHISTTSFSSSSAVDITSGFTGFDVFHMQVTDLVGSTNINFGLQFYESGTLETDSVYHEARVFFQVDGGSGEERSTNSSRLVLNALQSSDSAGLYINFYNFTKSSQFSYVTFQNAPSFVADYETKFGGGVLPQTSVVDGVRLSTNTGTMTGVANLYGYKI